MVKSYTLYILLNDSTKWLNQKFNRMEFINMEQKTEDSIKELSFEWTYHASINAVFDAITLPEHLKEWDCPEHLDISFAESKPKAGGEYRVGLVVPGGDGTEMMFVGKYKKVARPNQLTYTHAFSPGNGAPLTPETNISISLKQDGDKTLMQFKQTGFADKRAYEGARMSWPGLYTKLGNYLETLEE